MDQEGIHVGVINARFCRPLDKATLLKAVGEMPEVVTCGGRHAGRGFGSALLEAANAAGLDTGHIVRVGLPDAYVEHAERHEQLADLDLDAAMLKAVGSG